ncbi:MAG TPA: hypothetical protein VEC09_05865 [Actinomycetota bacterium]|nr:hypothetical protein [Actinomycetota bacterium]
MTHASPSDDAPADDPIAAEPPTPVERPDAPIPHRFELPDDLTPAEERAVIRALERYFAQESPHPHPWVLAGRIAASGLGSLQARHYTDAPWEVGTYAPFARRGVPPMHGRSDVG